MFKCLIKNFNTLKGIVAKYIPTSVKSEYKTMKNGIDAIGDNFYKNYTHAHRIAKLRGNTKAMAVKEGLTSAIAETRITKNEIPSLFAIAGGCSFPCPGTTEAGYALGRILTSKPAIKVYNGCRRVVTGAYSSIPTVLRP